MWQQMATQLESSVSITDQKDENKQAYWEGLEKSILKGYQSPAEGSSGEVGKMYIKVHL